MARMEGPERSWRFASRSGNTGWNLGRSREVKGGEEGGGGGGAGGMGVSLDGVWKERLLTDSFQQ